MQKDMEGLDLLKHDIEKLHTSQKYIAFSICMLYDTFKMYMYRRRFSDKQLERITKVINRLNDVHEVLPYRNWIEYK